MKTKDLKSQLRSALLRPAALATCMALLLSGPCSSWAAGTDDDDPDPSSDAAARSNFNSMMKMAIDNQAHNQAVIDEIRARAAQERAEQAARIAAFREQQRAATSAVNSNGGLSHLHDCNNPRPGDARIC